MLLDLSSFAHRLFGAPRDRTPDAGDEPPLSAVPLAELCPDLTHEMEVGVGRETARG